VRRTLYNIQEKLRTEHKTIVSLSSGNKNKENVYRGFFGDLDVWLAKKDRQVSTLTELAELAGLSFDNDILILHAKARLKFKTAQQFAAHAGIHYAMLSARYGNQPFFSDPIEWASHARWSTIEKIIRAVER
jgi:hypothetical protein